MREASAIDSWIFRPRPNPAARLRLFCVPSAGLGASMYRGWGELVGPHVELCALRLPGRESRLREPPFTRMADAVQEAARALQSDLDRPFALFGHSMGAVICFELTRLLRSQSETAPVHLFVSARPAPQYPHRRPFLSPMRDEQFVAEIRRRYNGVPGEVLRDSELMGLLLPVLRADVEMLETYDYRPGPSLGCPITAFGGREDTETPLEGLTGWKEQTNAQFRSLVFPGDHFFVRSAETEVLDIISRQLRLEVG
jgi:surfactin synthase thioesterase subunit